MGLIAASMLNEVRNIRSALDTDKIRSDANRSLKVGLVAGSEDGYQAMERFLCGSIPETDSQARAAQMVQRVSLETGVEPNAKDCDFILCEARVSLGALPRNGFRFDLRDPSRTADAIVEANPNLELALGHNFPAFRKPVSHALIHRISSENALCALISALPNVVPNVLELPWAIGEFATDTAFLTMNQIRMALQLAAAHDRPTGYGEQKMQIAAIAGGAFGWRALARELAGKIPLGGGLIPKAAIAFAGTWLVGVGLERVNLDDEALSRWERREIYAKALVQGKALVQNLAPAFARPR
jgi:hypothetical protein